MLTKAEIDRRLTEKVPGTERRVATGREREALETARQLGEWIEATAGESDGVPGCECSWCQSQRACKAWLRGEGESCPGT